MCALQMHMPGGSGVVGLRALVAAICVAVIVAPVTAITFTGNVTTDFPSTDPTVLLVVTETQVVSTTPPNQPTGWQLYEFRWAYNSSTDTAYFGEWLCTRSSAVPGRDAMPR